MNFSICTQICDRNSFLQQSLPTWLDQPAANEIVIIDWPNKEFALDVTKLFHDPRIRLLQIQNDDIYNKSIARNLAVKESKSDWVLYVDADILIDDKIQIELKEDEFVQGFQRPDGFQSGHRAGTALFSKDQYKSINGFDERMKAWGYEDEDFVQRLESAGYTRKSWMYPLSHIDHDDSSRTTNFVIKDPSKSLARNRMLAEMDPWGNKHERTNLNFIERSFI